MRICREASLNIPERRRLNRCFDSWLNKHFDLRGEKTEDCSRGLANGTARASPSNYGERKRGGWRPDMDMNTLDAGQHEPEKSSSVAPELQNKSRIVFSSNNCQFLSKSALMFELRSNKLRKNNKTTIPPDCCPQWLEPLFWNSSAADT